MMIRSVSILSDEYNGGIYSAERVLSWIIHCEILAGGGLDRGHSRVEITRKLNGCRSMFYDALHSRYRPKGINSKFTLGARHHSVCWVEFLQHGCR